MADEFGDGIEIETPVAEVASTPAPEPSTSGLNWFRESIGDPEGIQSDEELTAMLNRVIDRDELVRSTIGDEFDSDRLRSLVEAEQNFQRVAPHLSDFENWLQSRGQQPEMGAYQQPAPQSPAAAAAAKRRWESFEFDQSELRHIDRDPKTGLFVAPHNHPQLAAIADRANQFERRQRELAFDLARDPYAFGQEIVAPLLSERDAKLEALERRLQQYEQQTVGQSEWSAFMQQNGRDLQRFDVEAGTWVNTDAGIAFEKEFNQLLQEGVDPGAARSIALRHAREVTGSATAGSAPAAPVKGPRVVKRLAAKSTDVVPDAAGTLTDSSTPQTTRRLTGKALMESLVRKEMHKAGMAYDGD